MKKRILFFSTVLLPLAVLSNEPSAYGAGDSDVKSSYGGITSSEKKIFQNNEKVTNSNQNFANSRAETSNSNEQYEGVRSIMDGYGNKIAKMDERIRSLEKINDELKTENNQLKEYVAEGRKLQNDNQEKIKVVLGELSSLIDSINKNYVPKDKFDQLANEVRGKNPSKTTTPDTTKKETTKDTKPITSKELSTKDSATLIKEADDLYEKKSYNEAKVLYGELLNRNYKPAKVNFNLGEIAYTQKSYTSAIEHYKTSISLVEKAAYAPTLLHHTGLSFEKLSKNKEAQTFYKALKDTYPDSPEAKKVK